MPIDFRDGKTFPRRGREPLDGFLWLARITDKGRASAASTLHDYIYPCPLDRGMLKQWGVSPREFDDALRASPDDESISRWLASRVDDAHRERANAWLLRTKNAFLNRHDYSEGVAGATKPPPLPFDIVGSLLRV